MAVALFAAVFVILDLVSMKESECIRRNVVLKGIKLEDQDFLMESDHDEGNKTDSQHESQHSQLDKPNVKQGPATLQPQSPAPTVDRSWCPKAVCHSNVICMTCQRRFLIILTLGRSASTTLTWTLNYLPGVRMSGEEQGLLGVLMDFEQVKLSRPYEMAVQAKNRYGAFDHNTIPDGSLACASQKMVEAINPPCFKNCSETSKLVLPKDEASEIVGFKTIKFVNQSVAPKDAADFLLRHFPCARFIVNYSSDAKHQAESQIRAFKATTSVDAKADVIEHQAAYLMNVAKEIGDQAIVIDSAQWTKNITVLNEAVEWLGFTDCAFPRPLQLNTGATAGSGSPYSHSLIHLWMNPKCRYAGSTPA